MAGKTNFLDCPAWLDTDGIARCGLPAEVEANYTLRSTDGPLECARIRCPDGHWFNGPIESLSVCEPSAVVALSALPLASAGPQGSNAPAPRYGLGSSETERQLLVRQAKGFAAEASWLLIRWG